MKEYAVERIEKKRVINGITEYFLKWKGYPRSKNTWEPIDNLFCKDLVAEFEKSEKNKAQSNNNRRKIVSSEGDSKAVIRLKKLANEKNKKFGFDRGLEALKIIGATDSSGVLMFLMSWKNSDKLELVPATLANLMCPQIVIDFYEERLTWAPHIGNVKIKNSRRLAKKENAY
ncbi:chromobox protein homolog 1-like [Drosophila nasuta]|uniref:Chromobox protein homolog 1-like n=1 Tax=Drosophila albomicans TaxID=7291 RepID=A0A6P8X1P1_DROAB|nr:chromobox protein homolog 1-like [Drosophila albomicans]XP_060654985.1 chromobox protein homolog 1-like [Drosophila nasuta]